MASATHDAVRFLAMLASGAPERLTVPLFETMRLSGTAAELAELAARTALLSRLARLAAAVQEGSELRLAVAASLQESHQRRLILALVRDLAAASPRPVIAIKGAGLTLAGRFPSGDRSFVDGDLLVEEEHLGDWTDAAASVGAEVVGGAAGGYEAAYVHRDGALVELHVALPGAAGRLRGPSWSEVLASSVEIAPRLFVPRAGAAREIAVQHFVFHHAGEPSHALRTLQDLAALEGDGDEGRLDWGSQPVPEATVGLRRLADQFRSGEQSEETAAFIAALAAVVRVDLRELAFADDVERWVAHASDRGERGAVSLLVSRIFPSRDELGVGHDATAGAVAATYLRRAGGLFARYGRSKMAAVRGKGSRRELGRWRQLIGSNPKR